MDISKRCVVVALFTPRPNQANEVKAILSDITPEVHDEPGCDFYALHELPDGRLCFVEAWETRELWVQHGDATSVQKVNELVTPLLAKQVEVFEMYGIPLGKEKGIIPVSNT
jgi:quinol monooxygenase YgiN